MTRIDVLASEPHFIDHLAPVWLALPPEHRGDFILAKSAATEFSLAQLAERARSRGVKPVLREMDMSRPVLVASYGDQLRVRRRRRIIRMEHGIGQSFLGVNHPSYAGGISAGGVGLFLCPNEHSADRWRRAYPSASVAVVGSPHIETLPKRQRGPRPVIAISFHWGKPPSRHHPVAEQYGSFYEYMPTLKELPKAYTVIGHGHPREMRMFARFYARLGIEVVRDFDDVCRLADVYVCDTNSTIFEFASTGRPVVVVNGSHFRRDVEHGLRFWEAATVGVNCDSPADLVGSIARALEDPPEQGAARKAALDVVYAYRSGAAERAAAAIIEWAVEPLPVAV